MPAIKKRKLSGAVPETRLKVEKTVTSKVAKSVKSRAEVKAPVPVKESPEPESSEEEEDDEEEEEQANSDQEHGDNDNAQDGARKTFADLGVIDSLCEACANLGFKYPTPIQEQAIPLALQGRDM
jgi:ATP-dependent RNA helicase DDX47/RRP3